MTAGGPNATRVLQVTDPHLFTDATERMRDVPTQESFREVFAFLREHETAFDAMIFTGDLSHDHLESTYRWMRNEIEDWIPLARFLPGNHEDRASMVRVFQDRMPGVSDDGDSPIFFRQEIADWVLLGLDSHVPDEIPGRLQRAQVDWLAEQLARSTRPTMLFLHHPPVSVETPWMDRIGLQNPQPLLELIENSPQIRAVFCGHVHHEYNGAIGGAGFHTCPATSVQFKPRVDTFATDALPTGYRVIELAGDSYRTEVIRLPELTFPPEIVD